MSFRVYDFRSDITNLLVTPQIRSRFLRMEVGQYNESHTHDLGHEIFLILQGRAEFEIAGEKQIVEPGQLCIALTDEPHAVRNVGDEPVIMYLSVTPHIQPTHTYWSEGGEKLPPRFQPNSVYDQPSDRTTPTALLIDSYRAALNEVATSVNRLQGGAEHRLADMADVIRTGDSERAAALRDEIWNEMAELFLNLFELAERWNALTARTVDPVTEES